MRISTSQIFDSGLQGIQRNQTELARFMEQLSTGRKILTPKDDPIGASEALEVTQTKQVNDQFLTNQAAASTALKAVDSQLGNLVGELQSILEKAIQAGNSSYSPAQKGMIAEELKQRFQNILTVANGRDASGLYMFSGTRTQVQPFQVVGSGGTYNLGNLYVSYQGDTGPRAVQANATQTMNTAVDGQSLFMQVRDGSGTVTGRSLFDSVQNVIDILDPNSGVAYTAAAYTQGIDDLHAAIDHVSRIRADVGARMQGLQSLTSLGEDQKFQYQQRLSDLQDIDYAEAISNLTQEQLQLQAAQLSFKQVNQLSLFNIL
ncbi:MAG: flagellar hook-associated protein FlgL [Azonexus sp.]|nr:flagellar hook-associated protein FlgL [Betaproteobacteria bacterium]MBK8918701.1 flagellar hook-associated protein FlgL [Betaproteobacteria bacterium]MBP6034634.1 flagellar hook-associated protein FlgL [Azonexus sp.]MBP6905174.1 flagellar hook-associated protein FlgL [Azonexus sp.]